MEMSTGEKKSPTTSMAVGESGLELLYPWNLLALGLDAIPSTTCIGFHLQDLLKQMTGLVVVVASDPPS